MSFLIKSFNIENISFYNEFQLLYKNKDKESIKDEFEDIIKNYLKKGSELELNLPEKVVKAFFENLKKMEEINEVDVHIIDPILKEVNLMLFTSFNDFITTDEYSKTLRNRRN